MSNPLLPEGTQLTQEDLLLIIGDQTVTIAVLRQSLQNIAAGHKSQRDQLEKALKVKAMECDELKAKAMDANIDRTTKELRERVSSAKVLELGGRRGEENKGNPNDPFCD